MRTQWPTDPAKASLKTAVAEYWNRGSCGTDIAEAPKHSRKYFEEIEEFRYRIEPEIFAFAQFTRHFGKRLLEVGVGAGSDFLQWVRAGTQAHGVDLTTEAVENTTERLEVYGLRAEEVRVADAEHLPYPDDHFDIVYSWGVIHHSPDMDLAFYEMARVTKPGGTIKLMVYNRHSLHTFYWWVRMALLRGTPWRSFSDVLWHHMESVGTKAYTRREVRKMAERHGLSVQAMDTRVSPFYDLLEERSMPARVTAYILACLCGYRSCGWFLRTEMTKVRFPSIH